MPIVDQSNEQDWVAFATTHSRRELEREVKTAKREVAEAAQGQPTLLPVPRQAPATVVPVQVSLEMTPTQFARYESLWEQIRKQGGMPTDQVETLLAVMQSFSEANGPPEAAKTARPEPYPPLRRMGESIRANQPRRVGDWRSRTGTGPVRLPHQPTGKT